MLYAFSNGQLFGELRRISGLEVRESKNPIFMANLGQITPAEAAKRFEDGHKAYVAYLNNIPAAFGWVATRNARIGELNHTFTLPPNHLYLWNFRTLPEFHGQGIYPELLQAILSQEQPQADCFWIMHAPENQTSQRGILKTGFRFIGKVSVINGIDVIFTAGHEAMSLDDILNIFGFRKSEEEPATCWNCSSPYVKNRTPSCCCSTSNTECTQNLYAPV